MIQLDAAEHTNTVGCKLLTSLHSVKHFEVPISIEYHIILQQEYPILASHFK